MPVYPDVDDVDPLICKGLSHDDNLPQNPAMTCAPASPIQVPSSAPIRP